MADIHYTDDHEWARKEGDVAVIGITNYAQEQLGDIVFVELPEIGQAVNQGEEIAVIESVKAAGDLKSPVSGMVTKINEVLVDEPETVNQSPEADGWICEIEFSSADEFADLKDTDAYQAYLTQIA